MNNKFIASLSDKVTQLGEWLFYGVPFESDNRPPAKPYKKHERCLEDALFYWGNYKARVRLFRKSSDSTPVLLVTYRWGRVHDYLRDVLRVAKREFALDGKLTIVTHMPQWCDPMRIMFKEPRFCLVEIKSEYDVAIRDLSYQEFFDLSGMGHFEVYDDDEPTSSFITEEREVLVSRSNQEAG